MNRITFFGVPAFPGGVADFSVGEYANHQLLMESQSIAYVTACDGGGNSYLAGYKDNAFAYSEIMGDVYFNKYDASGNTVFSKTISGRVSVSKLLVDSTGSVYLLAFMLIRLR
jgi:hypothetical protein